MQLEWLCNIVDVLYIHFGLSFPLSQRVFIFCSTVKEIINVSKSANIFGEKGNKSKEQFDKEVKVEQNKLPYHH